MFKKLTLHYIHSNTANGKNPWTKFVENRCLSSILIEALPDKLIPATTTATVENIIYQLKYTNST